MDKVFETDLLKKFKIRPIHFYTLINVWFDIFLKILQKFQIINKLELFVYFTDFIIFQLLIQNWFSIEIYIDKENWEPFWMMCILTHVAFRISEQIVTPLRFMNLYTIKICSSQKKSKCHKNLFKNISQYKYFMWTLLNPNQLHH